MFRMDGKRTPISLAAQAILDNCGLPVANPKEEESFALVLYRKDPVDQYYYLTAYAGLREPEPMFGPLNYNDFRWSLDPNREAENLFGFQIREKSKWVDSVDRKYWQLHINGRSENLRGSYAKEIEYLKRRLATILEDPPDPSVPLYPDLWFKERLARDILRQSIQALPPGSSLEEVALHLSQALEEMFLQWLPNPSLSIGIYLDTGEDWQLVSPSQMRPWLSPYVEKEEISINVSGVAKTEMMNAFDWIGHSTRPLLLRVYSDERQVPLSEQWEKRLVKCGIDFVQVISDRQFSGMCIVPILHAHQQWRCMGIILLTARGSELHPAHLYLLSRLSIGVSGYLMPLLPIPGFSWWPDAKLRRGGANIESGDEKLFIDKPNIPEEVIEIARAAARDLMPTDSKVKVSALHSGHSGAHVFRLRISDDRGIPEVPRVLKVGPPEAIASELRRYYRYVHNKKVGGASRVDIARGFWLPHQGGTFRAPIGPMYGAIVYTLVGAGDQAIPWSEWLKNATVDEFNRGLDLLYDQLGDWYHRTRPEQVSVIDLMLRPLADCKLVDHLNGQWTTPSFTEVKNTLRKLSRLKCKDLDRVTSTCVVHGDLHADNIFAILWPDGQIKGVALIDWGNVRSGRHPLSDISKLMTDLIYKIEVKKSIRDKAFKTVEIWGKKLGCGEQEWRVAFVNQIARILFYRSEPESDEKTTVPYLSNKARQKGWEKLQELEQHITTVCR